MYVCPTALKITGETPEVRSDKSIPDICHQSHQYICGEKNCHVEKFQISMHDKCGDF